VVSQAATSPFNSDALLGALTPFRKTPVRVLGYGSGLWTAGTVLAGVNTSPEVLSVLYRTRVNITWTGATVGVMVVSDIVVGSTLGWTARITAINYGAKTAVLSLWTGIAAGAGAETLTSGGNSIAGVSVGAFAGSRTGYQATVTPGVFAPKAPGVAGIYNVVGARQDVTNGSRFPLEPYDYDLSIDLPQWHFAEGAILSIDLWGVLFCTIPAGDTPRIEFALAIGTSIFLEAELDIDRPNWPRFETAQLPSTINVDTPFHAKLRLVNCRRSDRTQQQLGSLQMEAGALSFVATAQAAIELEDGYNLVGKVSRRNVAIMLAVSPQVASANQFYVNVHTWRAELEAND
jgi:hypothetical protein